MAYTDKQERNGATGEVATQNTAVTGPMPDVEPLVRQAQDVGMGRANDALDFFSSAAGAGPAPSSNVADSDRIVGNPGGSVWDWDAGLAISEMPGEH